MLTTRPITTSSGIFNLANFPEQMTPPQTQTSVLETQPLMSGALPVPAAGSAAPTDPCSSTYVKPNRASTKPASIRSNSKISKRTAIKQWAKRVARALSSAFTLRRLRSGTKSTATETATPNRRSSTRSRRFNRATRMTTLSAPSPTQSQIFAHQLQAVGGSADDIHSVPGTPDIFAHTPSGKRLTVHSAYGPDSQPAPIRQSVLFAHPAATAVMPQPPTPMTATTAASDDSWSSNDEKHFSSGEISGNASSLGDLTGLIDPKKIFRMSYMGTQMTATPEAYEHFCNNLDGFKKQLQVHNILPAQPTESATIRSSAALPFIPKTPSLSGDKSSDKGSVSASETEKQNKRTEALQALTGTATANHSCPDILRPGKSESSMKGKPLVHRPATMGGSGLYLPFIGTGFNPFNEPRSPLPPLPCAATADTAFQSLGLTDRSRTPDFADNETYRKHYTRVESGIFDASSRPSTPNFADTTTHRQHYSRIESGVFDFDASLPSRPANPIRDARFAYFAPDSPRSRGAPVPPPCAPSSPMTTAKPLPLQIKRKPVGSTRNFSKPLNTNKSLPPPPSPTNPKRYTNGIVPAPYSMNDNGFPVLARNPRDSSDSAKAMYRQRTFSTDELKLRREEAKKLEASEKNTERKQQSKLAKMTAACGKLIVCGPR